MVSDLEQVDVLAAAAAQGRHVAAGVERGGLPTLGHSAPVHRGLHNNEQVKKVKGDRLLALT